MRWTCYQEKLQNGGQLPANVIRVLQRQLFGAKRFWSGGCLANESDVGSQIETIREISAHLGASLLELSQNELDEASRLMIYECIFAADELCKSIFRKKDRERKRLERATAIYQSDRLIYGPDRLGCRSSFAAHPRRYPQP